MSCSSPGHTASNGRVGYEPKLSVSRFSFLAYNASNKSSTVRSNCLAISSPTFKKIFLSPGVIVPFFYIIFFPKLEGSSLRAETMNYLYLYTQPYKYTPLTPPLITLLVAVQLLSHVWLCDPMDWSTLSFPVLHYLPELAQTHVHWLGDAIQPSHPLPSPSLPVLSLSQHHAQ